MWFLSKKASEKIVEICPVDIFEMKGDKLAIKKDDVVNCHLCQACVDASKEVELKSDNHSFIFHVESWGQLKCSDILKQAADVFQSKLDLLVDKLKAL